jgi:hypothetical protein
MTQAVFIKSGHGYDVSDRGRCTAFDGFTILAEPLPGYDKAGRESRVFNRNADGSGGITYAPYTIKLARDDFAVDELDRNDFGVDLYLLVQHGAGREVWRLPAFYDGGELQAHILAMPERLQFALLFSIYRIASDSRRQFRLETEREWRQAFMDGRIKKHRATKHRSSYLEILPPEKAAAE